jgi:hypothetical protein
MECSAEAAVVNAATAAAMNASRKREAIGSLLVKALMEKFMHTGEGTSTLSKSGWPLQILFSRTPFSRQ